MASWEREHLVEEGDHAIADRPHRKHARNRYEAQDQAVLDDRLAVLGGGLVEDLDVGWMVHGDRWWPRRCRRGHRPSSGSRQVVHDRVEGAVHADLNSQLSAASDPGFDPKHGGRHPLPPLERWTRLLGQWGIGPETPVVIYDEADGSNAAARAWWMLRAVGHKNVSVMDGGFRAAVARGERVTTESAPVIPRDPYPADRWLLPTVEMNDVAQLQPGWKILDVRSAPRYRGETEPIDPIAGHIPGAVNLPFAENLAANGRFKSPAELRAQYETLLDGTPPERLIVHCGSGVTACQTLLALDMAGLPGASLYVGSWSEWCRNK